MRPQGPRGGRRQGARKQAEVKTAAWDLLAPFPPTQPTTTRTTTSFVDSDLTRPLFLWSSPPELGKRAASQPYCGVVGICLPHLMGWGDSLCVLFCVCVCVSVWCKRKMERGGAGWSIPSACRLSSKHKAKGKKSKAMQQRKDLLDRVCVCVCICVALGLIDPRSFRVCSGCAHTCDGGHTNLQCCRPLI